MARKIMALGDSTSIQSPPNNYEEYLYADLLSRNQDVAFVGSANGPVVNGVTIWLEGHPGFQTYQLDVEDYIPNSTPQKWPDILLLMIGVNDLNQLMTAGASAATAAAETTRRLARLLQRIYRTAPTIRTFVAQIAPVKTGGTWDFITPALNTYNANIPAVARALGSRVSVVDCNTGYDATSWFSDDVHPDFRGARFVSKRFPEYGLIDAAAF